MGFFYFSPLHLLSLFGKHPSHLWGTFLHLISDFIAHSTGHSGHMAGLGLSDAVSWTLVELSVRCALRRWARSSCPSVLPQPAGFLSLPGSWILWASLYLPDKLLFLFSSFLFPLLSLSFLFFLFFPSLLLPCLLASDINCLELKNLLWHLPHFFCFFLLWGVLSGRRLFCLSVALYHVATPKGKITSSRAGLCLASCFQFSFTKKFSFRGTLLFHLFNPIPHCLEVSCF